MESLRELYRIGPGPSSSHTLAVKNACLYYLKQYPHAEKYFVELCGSLALTGKGHMTDRIISSVFSADKVIIKFNKKMYDDKPNVMIFHTLDHNELNNEMVIISTGGGAIEIEGQSSLVDKNIYPHRSLKEIEDFCANNNIDFLQYVYHFEPDIKQYLLTVADQMIKEIENGLNSEGVLPGELKLMKVARSLWIKSLECNDDNIKQKLQISAFAYAAMEENADGNTVVTAPTLGSCGVLSAILRYYYQKGRKMEELVDGLAVAGIFGNIVKTNATISGAVGGCQAEIGTACSMAAAFSAYLEKLPMKQIEYAAEIAMEHNLGLTCDPVGGYVQVPCIERNGQAALRSLDSMLYAKYLGEIRENKVSFDMIVEAMNYTGQKLAMELKETSLGGLAEVVPIKKDPLGC
ncbi:MAG: L-serine ammonia-lyase, iron-sulfur-dependent, subunit alpha [Erysipelotrichia bacterium]|nr:L-serine ammonia-lyase, iron-sulfur-dependent, subunit alpha [Erysipelotrichia bacterium]